MNPQLHDEFIVLSALFYTGELTDEEWALLQVHMAYCDSCRETFEQFALVSKDVIPQMAAAAVAKAAAVPLESTEEVDQAALRLMRRLEPAAFKSSVSRTGKKSIPRAVGGALAACFLLIFAYASSIYLRHHPEIKAPASAIAPPPPAAISAIGSSKALDTVRLQQVPAEEEGLREKVRALQDQTLKAETASGVLRSQLAAEQDAGKQHSAENAALSEQLSSLQLTLKDVRERLAAAQSGITQQSENLASLQAKVQGLNVELEEANSALNDKERMLALDQEFLVHDRDIRDLMGARNLYIADIFDTNGEGKTAKPFGRVFYTQDRSLVFYGFDLEKQPGLKHDVAFQAWGSGTDSRPVSLGIFYQDDGHKRWVLRCNDAKTLTRLNMIFVTVEPPGGSHHPTGKQLLRAYLQMQPNHP